MTEPKLDITEMIRKQARDLGIEEDKLNTDAFYMQMAVAKQALMVAANLIEQMKKKILLQGVMSAISPDPSQDPGESFRQIGVFDGLHMAGETLKMLGESSDAEKAVTSRLQDKLLQEDPDTFVKLGQVNKDVVDR